MKATWILAAALAVEPLASAQAQPMSQQPELKPPAVSEAPPLPQLPPGVLDGLAPPTQAPQSRPQGGPKSAAGGLESVVVRHATPSAAWISVYDAGLPTGGACVQPKGDMILAVDGATTTSLKTSLAKATYPGSTLTVVRVVVSAERTCTACERREWKASNFCSHCGVDLRPLHGKI